MISSKQLRSVAGHIYQQICGLHRIGTEHEKFGFQLDTLEPMRFEHISQILEGVKSRFNGYEAVMEG